MVSYPKIIEKLKITDWVHRADNPFLNMPNPSSAHRIRVVSMNVLFCVTYRSQMKKKQFGKSIEYWKHFRSDFRINTWIGERIISIGFIMRAPVKPPMVPAIHWERREDVLSGRATSKISVNIDVRVKSIVDERSDHWYLGTLDRNSTKVPNSVRTLLKMLNIRDSSHEFLHDGISLLRFPLW